MSERVVLFVIRLLVMGALVASLILEWAGYAAMFSFLLCELLHANEKEAP